MYIPKNQYKIKQAYSGEFTKVDGTEYTGPYIEVANGTFYQGDRLSNVPVRIFSVEESQTIAIERPYNDYFGPTEQNYTQGFYTRYFTRDKRNGKFVELSKEQWNSKKTLKYVTAGKLNWFLIGPLEDGKINDIPYKGTATRNLETLQNLEKEFPGITNFFDNPGQFVR